MNTLRAWCVRVLGVFTARRRERQFSEELESHLQLHIDDNIRAGMTRPEARRQALVKLGGVQAAREAYRDRVGLPSLESLVQDVRFALRVLVKTPGFTAIAVLVLALGIGANTAMFSFVNALLLRPLNGGALDGEIVGLYTRERTRPDTFRSFSYPEYVDIRNRNRVFDGLFAEAMVFAGLREDGITKRVSASVVSSNYFSVLSSGMAAGRNFTTGEEAPGRGTAVAIVSHQYWSQHGLDSGIIGRNVSLNGRPFTIVGVAPEGFNGTLPVMSSDVWVPLGSAELLADATSPVGRLGDRAAYALLVAGVLKRGVAPEAAEPLLEPLAAELAAAHPEHNRDRRFLVHSLSRVSRGPSPRSDTAPATGAAVFLFVSALVLLVACLNLANMLLARGSARQQEIALRLALGGGRARVVRQLLTEGLLLVALGGVAALFVAKWTGDLLVRSLVSVLPVTIAIDTSIDVRVVMATIVACVASTMIFSLGPAWKLSHPDVVSRIKQSASEDGRRRRDLFGLPNVLVTGQIALSLALIIAAGLFLRAGAKAAASDPGFALDGGLLARLSPDLIGYKPSQARAVLAEVLDRVRSMPDVRAASIASIVPFGDTLHGSFVERVASTSGRGTQSRSSVGISATFTVVGTDYFASIDLPLLAGREFTAIEERSEVAASVAIVDQTLAQRLFPGESALGQLVRFRQRQDQELGEPLQIVGIVPGVRDDLVQPAPAPHLYVPFGQHYRGEMTLHVKANRNRGADLALLDAIRGAVGSVDDRLPILSLTTMTRHRDTSLGLWAIGLAAKIFAAFGSVALLLATIGVYGLRSYLVARRTREFGIRVALGASPASVVSQIMREAVTVSTTGLALGFVLALGLGQVLLLSGMLDKVGAFDPLVLTISPVLLAGAAAVASYVPARRMLRLDPAVALRPD